MGSGNVKVRNFSKLKLPLEYHTVNNTKKRHIKGVLYIAIGN